MAYPRLGPWPIVPIADLTNLTSQANEDDDNRVVSKALGKDFGRKVLADLGSSVYAFVIALGQKSSSPWQIVDGSAQYLPVNLLNVGGGAAWTLTTSTYTGSLLTVATAAAAAAVQTVTLKAGKYRLSGTATRQTALKAAKLTVSGATDGAVINGVQIGANFPVDASNTTPLPFSIDFTLAAASQVVTFTHTICTIADGVAATGNLKISYSLEGIA